MAVVFFGSVVANGEATKADVGQFFGPLVGKEPSKLQRMSPADSRLRYEGRVDYSDPAAPVLIWQGSRLSIIFEGETLAFQVDGLGHESFFDVHLDSSTSILAVRSGDNQILSYQKALSSGRHALTLIKRSEAAVGTVRLRGILIDKGARVSAPAPISYKLAMQFIGDSITVGACNEDGATDQWENHLTHNNARSYAAMTAAAFSADYRNIAASGMGVITGYVEVRAGEMWDKLYPSAASAPAPLKDWIPDVLLVNLGENDDSFSRAKGQPFPPTFTDAYVSLVKAMRKAYPSTRIVLLRGGMYGGSQSAPLIKAWDAGVAQLEAGDSLISHYAFNHWSSNHPRVADDRAMADELIAWLKHQPFMKGHL